MSYQRRLNKTMASVHRNISRSSAGRPTVVLPDLDTDRLSRRINYPMSAAIFKQRNLQPLQPRIAQGWAGLLWLLGCLGTIAAFHGGFDNIVEVSIRPFLITWHGVDWLLVGAAMGLQFVVTALEFIYRNN